MYALLISDINSSVKMNLGVHATVGGFLASHE